MGEPRPDVTESIVLVRRAQDGDATALDRIVGRYYERVRRIVRLRLGPRLRRRLDSDDILQDTFLAAVQAFDRFEVRDDASLINWLSKIAEHRVRKAADRMGALKRDAAREVTLDRLRASIASGALSLEPAADIRLPVDQLAEAEQVDVVERALGELEPDHREAILLRVYAGASWRTVAELVGRPSPDAARKLYERALLLLTARVQERADDRRDP